MTEMIATTSWIDVQTGKMEEPPAELLTSPVTGIVACPDVFKVVDFWGVDRPREIEVSRWRIVGVGVA